jgi:cardiolipin synthase A/B
VESFPTRKHRLSRLRQAPALPAIVSLTASVILLGGCGAAPIAPSTGGPPAVPTGVLRVITEPEDGYRSVDALIAGARHTIDLSMYELADERAQGLLIAAARRGVRVRVLLDRAFGGESVNQRAFSQLASAGVPVRWAPAPVILHQKTVTVDCAVSAVMTGNLTSQFYPTDRDFVVIDKDPPAVGAVESVFADDWRGSPEVGGSAVAGLVWSPGAETALVDLINSARHSLTVENEEMESPAVESTLEAASRRGVEVEVTMTANPKWTAAFTALTRAGVHVSIYPDRSGDFFIHAKAMVSDDKTAFIGSQNFSTSSLRFNRELGVITSDPATVDAVNRVMTTDFVGATAWSTASPYSDRFENGVGGTHA